MINISLDNAKGSDLNTVQQILVKSKRVVCVTGAGISCSAGIPDFRSQSIAVGRGSNSDNSQGLYFQQFGNLKGRDLFDASILKREDTTLTFMDFMTALKNQCESSKPTKTHDFVAKLDTAGKLVSCYTQNIDSLEHKTDVRTSKIVQLHGHLDTLNCVQCSEKMAWKKEEVKEEEVKKEDNIKCEGAHVIDSQDSHRRHMIACPECESRALARELNGRRRTAVGWMRPNVVLYGEAHPQAEEIGKQITKDLKRRPDCLVVIGTSLSVTGIKTLVRDFAQEVKSNGGHIIFINRTPPAKISGFEVDFFVQGDCDSYMRDLAVRWPTLWSKTKQSTVEFKVAKGLAKTKVSAKSTGKVTKPAGRMTKPVSPRKALSPVSASRLNSH